MPTSIRHEPAAAGPKPLEAGLAAVYDRFEKREQQAIVRFLEELADSDDGNH